MARPKKQIQGARKPQHIHAPKKSKGRKERVAETDGFVPIGNAGHKTGQVGRRITKSYQDYESEDEEDQWAEELDNSEDEERTYTSKNNGEEKPKKDEEDPSTIDPFLGRDSWGRSIRNFYDQEGDSDTDSSTEAEDDMARALKEALDIRRSHLDTVAANDMGFGDYLALGGKKTLEGETKNVNDEKVALDLLLAGLSGSAKRSGNVRETDAAPGASSSATLELLKYFAEEYKDLKERVKKESLPALQVVGDPAYRGPRPTEACMDLLAFQLQMCLWMASFFNGCAGIGTTPQFLQHADVLSKALKKYGKVRKEMASPAEWDVLRDALRTGVRRRGDSAVTVSASGLHKSLYGESGHDDHSDQPGKLSVLERRMMKKAARLEMERKKALESLPRLPAEIQDPTGTRELSRNIKSNRGLMRIRKKFSGHARVANKLKYAKKVKKLSGRLRKADEQTASGDYAGESHGITSHVNRSRKLQ